MAVVDVGAAAVAVVEKGVVVGGEENAVVDDVDDIEDNMEWVAYPQ